MARRREVDKCVLQVLQDGALRFTEVKQRLSELLKRPVANRVVAANLAALISRGLVEKVIEDGHVKYRLTQQYFAKQLTTTLQGLLTGGGEQQLLYRLGDEEPPLIVFTVPPHGGSHADLDLTRPVEIIAERMVCTLRGYPAESQEEAEKLLFWSYWAGVQAYATQEDWQAMVEEAEAYAREIKEKMEGEWKLTGSVDALRRARAETALLQIIDMVKGLVREPNLRGFLRYLFDAEAEVERLRREIFRQIHREMHGGEALLDGFLDFHGRVLAGLRGAGLLPEAVGGGGYGLRYIAAYGDVWNAFFRRLAESPLTELSDIGGGFDGAVSMVKHYRGGLTTLQELPYRSRTLIVYLWGYPEAVMMADKSFLPRFEDWLQALKDGCLDHRSYLFEPEVEKTLLRAIRSVKQGKPPRGAVDYVSAWTLTDLWRNHPRGRDPGFYMEILETIRERRSRRTEGDR